MAYSLIANTKSTRVGGASPGIDTTGADLLIAVVSGYNPNTSTLTDSKGNTWASLSLWGASESKIRVMYVTSPTVGSGHTFTSADGLSGVPGSVVVSAWSGSAASPVDQETGAAGSGSSLSTGSVTPTESDELLIAGVCWYPSGAVSIGGGFTITDQIDYVSGGSGNMGIAGAYLIQTIAAAANPAWSHSGFTSAAAVIVSFKAAGGGGGGAGGSLIGGKLVRRGLLIGGRLVRA